jgi:hypothetical protein
MQSSVDPQHHDEGYYPVDAYSRPSGTRFGILPCGSSEAIYPGITGQLTSGFCGSLLARGTVQPEREIVNTEKIAAHRLSLEEVTKLGVKDRFFVSADTAELKLPGCYVPAFLTKPGEDFEGGSITARTIFQEEVSCLPDDENEAGIYLADENGSATIEVLQSAGVVLDLALFVPGGDKGSLTALYAAARQAFGPDIVQIWRQDLKEVPDVKVDIFEEQIPRGRKVSDSSKRDRRAIDTYPTRAAFIEFSAGWKPVIEIHRPIVDDTPTI